VRTRRNRRPPLSGKQTTPPPSTRKERRAAERRDRFEVARDERKTRSGSGGGSSIINTKTMTIAGIAVGVLIVVLVAAGQLGNRVTGRLDDPGFSYPAALLDGPSLGSPDAPVVMEMYEDFQCPVCARYSLDVEPTLVAQYVANGQLRIEHNDLDLLGRGTNESLMPALGAYCANEQGSYWPYAHWVYSNQDGENQGGFRRERVVQIAVAAGVEEAAFTACLDSAPAAEHVAGTTAAGLQLGVNSTPTAYINGTPVVGLQTAAEYGRLIEAALAAASGAPASPDPSASTTP
jgi:protein-disulfide isomerase